MSRREAQRGFTLVEIMVAVAIGLFLTAGMLQMYVSNRLTYRFTESLSRMQESGRYALELLAKDMRMADFRGCSRGNNLTVDLAGWCTVDTASGTAPAAAAAAAIATNIAGEDGAAAAPDNPDSITLRGAVGTGLVVDPVNTDSATLTTQAAPSQTLSTGDFALVADCRGGDLFQVTGLNGNVVQHAVGAETPGNATAFLSKAYDQTAAVHRWREIQYFIQTGANGRPALWMRENRCRFGAGAGDDNAREVVEGVENMQITYGVDADGDGTADRYVRRTAVADMDQVVSVRIALLLASVEDDLADQAQTITFDDNDGVADDTFVAPDRRVYQVVTATFMLRNRAL